MADGATRARGPYRKTQARRQAILDAALTVFSTSGYSNGSLREIGAVAGLDPSSILHHFATKEALLEAVLEDKEHHDLDGMPPVETVEARRIPELLIALAERNDTLPEVIALYAVLSTESTTADHPSAQYFRERTERTRRDFVGFFQRMADEGLLAGNVDAEYAALSTFAIWDGIQIHWLIEPGAVSVTGLLREHLRRITRVPLP